MTAIENALISVVVVTRNRPSLIRQNVESLQRLDYPNFEVVVVDQSDNQDTEMVLRAEADSFWLAYIRSAGRGLSSGRNLGFEHAAGEIIALTDDDCAVEENWLTEIAAAFAGNPALGVVFTNVSAGSHDRSAGFIPAYVIQRPFLARSMRHKHRVEGIGASMAVRRSVWRDLHGFDPHLGSGSVFRGADDLDFAMRSLQGGYRIYETPRTNVVHLGFRTWSEGRALIQGYFYGIGAMYAKHLKLARGSVLVPLWYLFWRWLFRSPAVDLGHTPPRMLRLRAFLRGFVDGLKEPVDHKRCHYADRRTTTVGTAASARKTPG